MVTAEEWIWILIIIYAIFLRYWIRKRVPVSRIIFSTTMYVYLACVAGYTILPVRIDPGLTEGGNWYLGINLIPFASIYDTYVNTVYMGMNIRIGISQIVGNIIMFIPLGCLYPLCSKYHVTWKRMLCTAFVLSLSIEICQLLQNIFYQAAYRSADVDDLIWNTTGGLIGYALFLLCKPILQKLKVYHF
ncbi:hypothetical protein HB900_02250 [Listeria booriae]|uniref:VanZ family protein n=1 Tax=Listeria booriae TaxID=1552123 RepID=UPI00162900EB|nr:VanZ family protein [Listeria booriae]MBC1573284.1 hypothetical protein [Listeria booriae]